MKVPTLTQIAKGQAFFQWYSEGVLRYALHWTDEGGNTLGERFEFDISINDAGGGHFTTEMKGMSVLRWARKEIERLETEERLNEKLRMEWAAKLAENGGAEG